MRERTKAHADIEAIANISRASRAMKVCERIYQAGSACGDMGWLLKRAGRQREGEQWCEFDRLLEGLAWEVKSEEDAKAALVAAEEKRRARARSRVQVQAQVHRREVVEID